MLLVSDTSGKVTLISITGDYRKDNLYPSLLKPTAISIDWLTDWVYIASGNKVSHMTCCARLINNQLLIFFNFNLGT